MNAAQIGMRCGDKKAGSLTHSILSDNWYVIVLPASYGSCCGGTYLQWQEECDTADTRGRLEKYFLPKFGDRLVSGPTGAVIPTWISAARGLENALTSGRGGGSPRPERFVSRTRTVRREVR